MNQDLRDAITAAVELNEGASDNPYRLSFARKAESGASFGKMQGDLSAQQLARDTLKKALLANGVDMDRATDIVAQLSRPMATNGLDAGDDQLVEAALASNAGRSLVDEMDQQISARVIDDVEDCLDTAQAANREVEPKAAIYMAMWINMSGPPTTLKVWLGGQDVFLAHHTRRVAAPGDVVTAADVEGYLQATDYFTANPRNFAHLEEAAAAGVTAMTA
ncbi:MAG TPA: hypothetical protein VGU20_23675 [Stellaceae bacterium]|nr:hypothetical protein [Stellaceae bacterium]